MREIRRTKCECVEEQVEMWLEQSRKKYMHVIARPENEKMEANKWNVTRERIPSAATCCVATLAGKKTETNDFDNIEFPAVYKVSSFVVLVKSFILIFQKLPRSGGLNRTDAV